MSHCESHAPEADAMDGAGAGNDDEEEEEEAQEAQEEQSRGAARPVRAAAAGACTERARGREAPAIRTGAVAIEGQRDSADRERWRRVRPAPSGGVRARNPNPSVQAHAHLVRWRTRGARCRRPPRRCGGTHLRS
eukprot:scaffold1243_cov403-Prasinococcus_capsulatus_cf.AAC.1